MAPNWEDVSRSQAAQSSSSHLRVSKNVEKRCEKRKQRETVSKFYCLSQVIRNVDGDNGKWIALSFIDGTGNNFRVVFAQVDELVETKEAPIQ